jgi:excisionase family DNA binding protein
MTAKTPKRRKRRLRRSANPRSPQPHRLAVSTGQAARYCLVSSDTIANWIAAGRLPAQRTVGGQYRIRLADLRSFMAAHGMRTDLLEQEADQTTPCWQFWTASGQHEPPATCLECPVYRGQARVCHELRPLLPGGTQRALSCADCAFLEAHGEMGSERG